MDHRGHTIAIPGLGNIRFGLRSKSVQNVESVVRSQITSRRVTFVPNADIKKELAAASINITCYDRNGNIVKRVTSIDDAEVEGPEVDNTQPGNEY